MNAFRILLVIGPFSLLFGQSSVCDPIASVSPLSPRTTNYVMDLSLDRVEKRVSGQSTITWINTSDVKVSTVEMYMYLNAFKNNQSSYLRNGARRMPTGDLVQRGEKEWGYVTVINPRQSASDEILEQRYIQKDDQNKYDQSVLEISLLQAIAPGDTLQLQFDFVSKLPKTISRSGYAAHDFFHFVHWYPKLGVYESDLNGEWDWNCHQFLPQMEFYGDHGNYNVTIELDSDFTIGGSGCLNLLKEESEKSTYQFQAEDVIDFAWCASPHLKVHEDQWRHVDIRYLYPSSHAGLVDRLVGAAKNGLSYMTEHVGPYPYNTLTILDPPIYGLRSGFMEYPTYITGGAFHCWPRAIRSIESLIIHEFAHQYFMQILASNEKEDPWLDEGFVTFYEDCIMEDSYGEEASLASPVGYRISNSAFTRNEYTSLENPSLSPIDRNSWEIEGSYKGIVYAKMATVLQTIKAHLGDEDFDLMMQSYFQKHQFTHPRRDDFLSAVHEAFSNSDSHLSEEIDLFLSQAIDGTDICDYTVQDIYNAPQLSPSGRLDRNGNEVFATGEKKGGYNSQVTVIRKGEFIIPVEIEFIWENGNVQRKIWDGKEAFKQFDFQGESKLVSATIDPDFLVRLDVDYNNNSLTLEPEKKSFWKYATRSVYWVQNVLQATNFLM